MATQMAARGPLNALLASPGAQYIALGTMGGMVLLGPDKFVETMRDWLLHLATATAAPHAGNSTNNHSPIVVHVNGNDTRARGGSGTGGSLTASLISYAAGAGMLWVAGTVCTQLVPQAVQGIMPVTRQVFYSATQKLAEGVCQVKESLQQQLTALVASHEKLQKSQDATKSRVDDCANEIAHAREDVLTLTDSVARCEHQLERAEMLQTYTARGVQLLVETVSPLVQNAKMLQDYAKEGKQLRNSIPHNSVERLLETGSQDSDATLQAITPPPVGAAGDGGLDQFLASLHGRMYNNHK